MYVYKYIKNFFYKILVPSGVSNYAMAQVFLLCLNRGASMPWGWTVANALVFRKVRQALGLDRCKICMTAAAPIMRETLDFFASLNIPILELFGMSETSGNISYIFYLLRLSTVKRIRVHSVNS